MNIDKIENIAIIGAVIGGIYLLWKSGVFKGLNDIGKGLSYLESGQIGTNVANTVVGSSSPINQTVVANGGVPVTIGQIAANSNPLTFLNGVADALEGNAETVGLSLNVDATDKAFAKEGMTTVGVESLIKDIGDANASALLLRLRQNNLSAQDKVTLYAHGWDGTCQYW